MKIFLNSTQSNLGFYIYKQSKWIISIAEIPCLLMSNKNAIQFLIVSVTDLLKCYYSSTKSFLLM